MIFVVVGVHRSGTSMMAGLLHHGGIVMGTRFRRALPENPMGFFEEEAFRDLNDRVLERSSYVVKSWSPAFNRLAVSRANHREAVALIRRFDERAVLWGWKDPRNCLTLPMWLRAIEACRLMDQARVIVMRRDVAAVAKSLYKRGNVSSLDHGVAIWHMYNRELDNCLSQWAKYPLVLEVCYERIVEGSDIQRLEHFCGVRVSVSHIDPSLNHSGHDKGDC